MLKRVVKSCFRTGQIWAVKDLDPSWKHIIVYMYVFRVCLGECGGLADGG